MAYSPSVLADRLDAWQQQYIKDGSLPCMATVVSVGDEIVYKRSFGFKDKTNGVKLQGDETYIMASCTKVATSVAAMQLYEAGLWKLSDPVGKFIPSFNDVPGVIVPKGSVKKLRDSVEAAQGDSQIQDDSAYDLEPLSRPITMRDIMTHTSGLTVRFSGELTNGKKNLAQQPYQNAKYETCETLEEMVDKIAGLPLCAQPGTAWNYSVGLDVAARVVEVLSGMDIGEYFDVKIFTPLGMTSTTFVQRMTPDMSARLVEGWATKDGKTFAFPALDVIGTKALNPSGGLVSTLDDWLIFTQCLTNGGVAPNGTRILNARTVDFMATNHLPDGCEPSSPQMKLICSSPSDDPGYGFGLGVAVATDPARKGQSLAGVGSFEWGGATSTNFWCDRANKVAVVQLTQLLPSTVYPLRTELKQIVYGWLP